ncbi:hypothetical protein EVAR_7275_1 [Eumeta japonica]|uniref:Uncharacterized protein n=1 Tax=Eumeta variegata TaxID=151549 RepID=A0A4C1T5D7_EUMVA|nr:hypothetical protein EVAR_7275_1 [Eumeta japonica]
MSRVEHHLNARLVRRAICKDRAMGMFIVYFTLLRRRKCASCGHEAEGSCAGSSPEIAVKVDVRSENIWSQRITLKYRRPSARSDKLP